MASKRWSPAMLLVLMFVLSDDPVVKQLVVFWLWESSGLTMLVAVGRCSSTSSRFCRFFFKKKRKSAHLYSASALVDPAPFMWPRPVFAVETCCSLAANDIQLFFRCSRNERVDVHGTASHHSPREHK